MTSPLDPQLLALAERLGWGIRPTGNPAETMLGDYAHGYLLLDRGQYTQLARRSEKGEPSLKLWSPSVDDLQKYLAFNIAQLVRYREGLGAPVSLPTDPSAVRAPFALVHDDQSNVFLRWSDGEDQWAGFGRGNEFVAVQFSHYALLPIAEIIDAVLAADAAERFRDRV